MNDKSFISNYGLFATIVVTILGVNVFSYPSELTKVLGTEGWVAIVISGIIAILFVYALSSMIRNNGYKHIYEIFVNSFGSIVGRIISIFFALYSIYFVSLGLRIFTEEVKAYLLEKTPTEFIFVVTILVGTYIVRGEIENLIRLNEISFWIMFIPVFFIFIFAIYKADFGNLLPIFNQPIENYFNGVTIGMNRYVGFEILLLVLPFMRKKDNILRTTIKGVIFVIAFYIITFILAIGVFGVEQTKTLLWPTITMVKSIDIPGSFVERWEGIMMSVWILFYFTTFTNHYYFSADMIRKVMDFRDIKLSSAILVPLIYLIALYPDNISQIYTFSRTVTPIFFLINIVIIIIAFLISSAKGGRKV